MELNNILRVYSVIGKPFRNEDGLWTLQVKIGPGGITDDNVTNVTFDDVDTANQFKKFINDDLAEVISLRMQDLAEELFSLQQMVESGELFWQLASEDEDEDEGDQTNLFDRGLLN